MQLPRSGFQDWGFPPILAGDVHIAFLGPATDGVENGRLPAARRAGDDELPLLQPSWKRDPLDDLKILDLFCLEPVHFQPR